MAIESYARGIPTYKGENGQTVGLLCETKEQCITDDDGVRLPDKLLSMQKQIGEGPDFTGYATEDFVNNAVSGLATAASVTNITNGTTVVPKATNADTVDNYHAIDFLAKNGSIKAYNPVSDLNSFYLGVGLFNTDVANIPPGGSWWLVISGGLEGTTAQIAIELSNTVPAQIRNCAASLWGGWGDLNTGCLKLSGGTVSNLKISKENSTNEGGQVVLEKPTTTEIAGDVVIDINANRLRIFENAGSYRGVNIDITKCSNTDSTELLHTGNSAPCVVVETDPGVGASVSYADNTLIFVLE